MAIDFDKLEDTHHGDMRLLHHDIATLDKRVAVLETRIDSTEHAVSKIEVQMKELNVALRESGDRITDALRHLSTQFGSHVVQEDKDRIKLLSWVITTFLAVAGSMLVWAGPWIWSHLINP